MKTKITALIEKNLIADAIKLSKSKNTTEALIIALQEYVRTRKLKLLSAQIRKSPLKFDDGFTAEKARNLNNRF